MTRVIIIGGGILGASTAYQLSKMNTDVLLVDRGDAGQGTDAAAGIICPWISQRRNKAWYQLAKKGAAYYPSLISQLREDGEVETGYRKTGAVSIHTEPEKLMKIEKRVMEKRLDASEIGEIMQKNNLETKALFPVIDEKYASVYVSGAARVDGRALKKSLLRAAEKNGTKMIDGSAEIIIENQKVTGIRVHNKFHKGDKVIVTAGAWAGSLMDKIGIDFQVRGQKAQIVHVLLPGKQTGEWPVVMPPNDQYIVAFDEGRIVMGGTHEDDKEFDVRQTAGGIAEILTKGLDAAPGLADASFIETRVGYRPFTPNSLPVIGQVPSVEELFTANGLGASGLTMGPFLGLQLAKLALGLPTDIQLDEYDVANAIRK